MSWEIAWVSHLSLQACLLPVPKGTKCSNYARCVNQILQNLNSMQLWLRIPLEKADVSDGKSVKSGPADSWELWNSFRCLCEHHNQLSVALEILSSLPSANSLGRWFGEPVKAAIIHTDSFLTNARGYPCLSKRHQGLVTSFFNYSVQIVLCGKGAQSSGNSGKSADHVDGVQKHPLKSYLDYVGYLYQRMDPLSEQERFEIGYRDFLQSPLQYRTAISKALLDRVPDEKASGTTTVLMVVGAGRGPLVRAALQSLVKLEGWQGVVTIISSDMRCWGAPDNADILVSELLGSFGDNELSPECLDGAHRFLKDDGISIPSSLRPIKIFFILKLHMS